MSTQNQPAVVGKRRDWAAYVNVAAKGTLFQPYQRADPMSMHPKALANLEYTTADVDYWDDYWRNGDWSRRPSYETHATLRDADYAALDSRLAEVKSGSQIHRRFQASTEEALFSASRGMGERVTAPSV